MTISRTYLDMQNRIADELGGRLDLMTASPGAAATPIQLAIQDAIRFHENDRFYFNELRSTAAFNTFLGQEFYTSSDWSEIPNLKHIDKMTITVGSNRYLMHPVTYQEIEDESINPIWTGWPIKYAYYNRQLRFYPVPNGAYPINISGTKTFTELSASIDTNVWMDEAEALIRLTAEWTLNRDTLRDDIGAQRAQRAWQTSYSSLKGETMKRIGAVKMKPSYF